MAYCISISEDNLQILLNSPTFPWHCVAFPAMQSYCTYVKHVLPVLPVYYRGIMSKMMKPFICRVCLNPVTSTGRTSVDIGARANLELVDKFCYLGDTMNVDRDADAVAEVRIWLGWNKFRQLVSLLTNKEISLTSLIMKGRRYSSCVQSSMLHGSETWPVRKDNEVALQRAETTMVRWMCDVKVIDRVPTIVEREIRIRWHNLGTTAKQVAMVGACVAKRR